MTDSPHDDMGLQTLAIHGGESPDPSTGASSPNLVMSSTYVVDEEVSFSANNLAAETPFVYTRWDNPTSRQLESKLSLLENAEAIALPSTRRIRLCNRPALARLNA